MGSWDCYCAICGGPFCGVKISRKPRTARFRRKWAKDAEQPQEGDIYETQDVSNAPEEQEDDTESLDPFEEDYSYDPEVISEDDVKWTKTLHVLGFNPEANGLSKAFVAGPGEYSDYGGVSIEGASDTNAEGVDVGDLSCYSTWDSNDPVFPFHWGCFELLAKCQTGSFDIDKLNKDLLFSIMRGLAPDYGGILEDIDYGANLFTHEQFWESQSGYEFLVSNPRVVPGAEELVLSMFGSSRFEALPFGDDMGERVKTDPFTRLPYDLIHKISTMLDDGDLLNLEKASWPVHALFRGVGQFWQQRLKKDMPWFFELHDVLERDPSLLQGNDPKRIYLWAEKVTRPRRWATGLLMGVINRRRVWTVCEQLCEGYLSRVEPEEPSECNVEERILRNSKCSSFVTVSAPEAAKADVVRNSYWLMSWSELYSTTKEIYTFWKDDFLVGISLAPASIPRVVPGREWQLLGMDNTTEGVSGAYKKVDKGDWITGIIIHIPILNSGRCSRRLHQRATTAEELEGTVTSPKGLTVILKSGERLQFGSTTRGYLQRYLPAAPNWYITGMTGMTGEVDGNQQFTRLGLLQAQHPELAEGSTPAEPTTPPKPTALQSLLWDANYRDVLQHDIWNHPTLRLVHVPGLLGRTNHGVHQDLIPHEALIWARDQRDLRSLRRLSSYVVVGGTMTCLGPKPSTRDIHDVCGINAEYTPESAFMRRMIGINKSSRGSDMISEDPWQHFEVDGPGGEMVTEVQYAMHEKPKAMKIRTNRGRECYWGEVGAQGWQSLTAPPGETLIGLVMAFAEPSGYSHETNSYAQHKLSFVGALSMPLGIPEESQPVGE